MTDRFLARQLLQLGLAGNALRPVPGEAASIPAFFAGWLTGELAPHLLAFGAADAALHVARHGVRTRRDALGLAVAAANLATYARLVTGGRRAAGEIEDALVAALGPDYRDVLARDPLPTDDAARWSALALPFWMREAGVVRTRRLPYAPGGRRFELDVYHRTDMPPDAPILLQIHGGGWVVGNKDQKGIPLMLHMAARGWVCFAINYPLSPRARWPEHLVAVKRAVQWIRTHGPEYGADPAFLAVTGGSAGGHLAAMLALTAGDATLQPGFTEADTSVQACAPHYGVYDFADSAGTSTTEGLDALLRRYVMRPDAVYPDDLHAFPANWNDEEGEKPRVRRESGKTTRVVPAPGDRIRIEVGPVLPLVTTVHASALADTPH
ncbi:MAG: alpha/beta hydrolase [Actinobacteria bacterium]|nr:alpha/beta hydrolase [Actinomycetota bacterium]